MQVASSHSLPQQSASPPKYVLGPEGFQLLPPEEDDLQLVQAEQQGQVEAHPLLQVLCVPWLQAGADLQEVHLLHEL